MLRGARNRSFAPFANRSRTVRRSFVVDVPRDPAFANGPRSRTVREPFVRGRICTNAQPCGEGSFANVPQARAPNVCSPVPLDSLLIVCYQNKHLAPPSLTTALDYLHIMSVGSRSMFGAQPHSKRPSAPAYGFGGTFNDKLFIAPEEGKATRVDKIKDHKVPPAPPLGRPARPRDTVTLYSQAQLEQATRQELRRRAQALEDAVGSENLSKSPHEITALIAWILDAQVRAPCCRSESAPTSAGAARHVSAGGALAGQRLPRDSCRLWSERARTTAIARRAMVPQPDVSRSEALCQGAHDATSSATRRDERLSAPVDRRLAARASDQQDAQPDRRRHLLIACGGGRMRQWLEKSVVRRRFVATSSPRRRRVFWRPRATACWHRPCRQPESLAVSCSALCSTDLGGGSSRPPGVAAAAARREQPISETKSESDLVRDGIRLGCTSTLWI